MKIKSTQYESPMFKIFVSTMANKHMEVTARQDSKTWIDIGLKDKHNKSKYFTHEEIFQHYVQFTESYTVTLTRKHQIELAEACAEASNDKLVEKIVRKAIAEVNTKPEKECPNCANVKRHMAELQDQLVNISDSLQCVTNEIEDMDEYTDKLQSLLEDWQEEQGLEAPQD